ncbi:hypothetical protein AF72_00645 [Xylella taiwanensis]|uniref:Uncharacterized protein n=1 Tax=Xylella taiwanensis TaxID=1444770 RepID=Z9JM08_9GAMM|nr:hypothetical protein AB672_11405 [Xylella taiwanensis]EWS79445.1 hypothetical protein AF72_00645 [Xylella taiwanensis]
MALLPEQRPRFAARMNMPDHPDASQHEQSLRTGDAGTFYFNLNHGSLVTCGEALPWCLSWPTSPLLTNGW